MASKFDEYLKNMNSTPEEKSAMAEMGRTREEVSTVTPPPPTSGAVNANQPTLSEETAERIQGIDDGPGNNHEVKKDSLSQYPTSEGGADQAQEQTIDQEPER